MGVFPSKSKKDREEERKAAKQNDRVAKQLSMSKSKDDQFIKMLFLGAAESGKSTIFKQITRIFGGDGEKLQTEAERVAFRETVFKNIIQSLSILAQQSQEFEVQDDEKVAPSKGSEKSTKPRSDRVIELRDEFSALDANPYSEDPEERYSNKVRQLVKEFSGNAEYAKKCAELWADEGIKETWSRRKNFQIFDNADYFCDRIDEIAKEGWTPSFEDVIRSRERTTAVISKDFKVKDSSRPLRVVDVGGQRNEREKWLHHFDNVRALIFVVALSAYDQKCAEDNETPRMDEALTLFEEIVNNKWFKDKDIILFLNKEDLFAQKIKKTPISVFFHDCPADVRMDKDAAIEYIKGEFEKRIEGQERKYHPYVTCATDSKLMEKVITLTTELVLNDVLRDLGYL